MPIINLPKRKEREQYKRTNYSKRDSAIHREVYNTQRWRELRLEYLIHNPLCEVCIEKGIIESAVDVHHRIPISHGVDMLSRQTLGFDYMNLMSLCKECHRNEHKKII